MSELSQGTKINSRYTLQEYKGSGSFGEVWLAHDDIIDTEVALKIYVSLNPAGISQFTEEYKTTANLSHPNLLTAKHFDVWERRPFLEMKYCGQGSADKLVGNITEKELWHFIHDVAAGLHYLHDLPEPIIHQDIKPDNVLMDDDGMFLITDFGISKQLRATIRKQSGRSDASGSCAYMGPERFNADPTPIKASDIWSLGASIYELAKGELPFCGQGGVMLKNGADLPELGAGWSSELNQTIQACLAKDPWDRPTAEQLEKYAESMIQSLEAGRPVATALWIKPKKTEPIIIPSADNATVPIGKQETPKKVSLTSKEGDTSSNKKGGLWLLLLIPLIALGSWGIIHKINKDKELAAKGYIDVESMKLKIGDEYGNSFYVSDLNQRGLIVRFGYKALSRKLTNQRFSLAVVGLNGKELITNNNVYFPSNSNFKEIEFSTTPFKEGRYTCDLMYNGIVIAQVRLKVEKKPATYLNVASPSRSVTAESGNVTFQVQSDALWSVSSAVPSWCSVRNKTGNSFDVEYSENTSSNSRTAQITISSETGNMSKQVEIIQKGKNMQTTSYSNSNSYKEVVSGYENGHAYVDLGLPSGTLWATCNIGANRPEEYGNYYAWGEITTKRDYSKRMYKYSGNPKNLPLANDAARTIWRGNWRMPTNAEFYELLNNCTWIWTTQSAKRGYKAISKKNGNSLFFPCTGSYWDNELMLAGLSGDYWSASRNESGTWSAYCFGFYDGNHPRIDSAVREGGRSIRPVLSSLLVNCDTQ